MFRRIGRHVYYKEAEGYSDRSTVGYIKGEKFSLLFESGASMMHGKEILDDLNKASLPYPSLVSLSHWHWDHSFGLSFWKAPSIASSETNEKLKELSHCKWDEASILERIRRKEEIVFCFEMMKREYGDTNKIKVVPATMNFRDDVSIDLGGVRCILSHVGGPHSSDSVVLYVEEDKVLFLGDSHGKDLYGYPWHFDINEEDKFMENVDKIPYDETKVREYINKIETFDFSLAVPGHSEPIGKEDLFSLLSNKG